MSVAVIEYTDARQLIADAKARRAMFYSPRVAVSPAVPQRKIKAARMAQPHNYPPTPAKIIEAAAFRDWMSVASPEALRPSCHRRVLLLVCGAYGISLSLLTGQSRAADIVLPRMVACWIMRNHTGMSLPDIGRRLGGRDHTTALSAIRKIDRLLAEGRVDIRRAIDGIVAVLRQDEEDAR